MPRVSKGRKKVKIAKMENWRNRRVTFSKRREGLFMKACELCTRCGVEIAIIVFSPNGNKVYSLGHPSVYEIMDRYLARYPLGNDEHEEGEEQDYDYDDEDDDDDDDSDDDNDDDGDGVNELIEAYRNVSLTRIHNELMEKQEELAREKKQGKELETVRRGNVNDLKDWWKAPIAELNIAQLQEVKEGMESVLVEVEREAQRLKMENENITFPYKNFGSALAPGRNFDANEPSGSESSS